MGPVLWLAFQTAFSVGRASRWPGAARARVDRWRGKRAGRWERRAPVRWDGDQPYSIWVSGPQRGAPVLSCRPADPQSRKTARPARERRGGTTIPWADSCRKRCLKDASGFACAQPACGRPSDRAPSLCRTDHDARRWLYAPVSVYACSLSSRLLSSRREGAGAAFVSPLAVFESGPPQSIAVGRRGDGDARAPGSRRKGPSRLWRRQPGRSLAMDLHPSLRHPAIEMRSRRSAGMLMASRAKVRGLPPARSFPPLNPARARDWSLTFPTRKAVGPGRPPAHTLLRARTRPETPRR